MSCGGGEDKQWGCGKSGAAVNFQRVGSIVRDIGDPCLSQSPIKVNKMLKPEKWQATFDSDGKNFCFQKALKLIVLGGVDQSIRPEVWEFLLGCYALGSTAESRRQLRTARRCFIRRPQSFTCPWIMFQANDDLLQALICFQCPSCGY